MDTTRLRALLTQPEGANLEFKQQYYKLSATKDESKKREKDEFIKDILSLANGNANVAGETSYLIIGVADTIGSDGERDIHGVGSLTVTSSEILQMVNAACEPPIEDLQCEIISLDDKNILVISIPPGPHLHETIRGLTTSRSAFTERTVFIRRNESIEVASARDRSAIQELKAARLQDQQNAPPIEFGIIVGIALGKILGDAVNKNPGGRRQRFAYQLAGMLFGGAMGGMLGNSYRGYNQMRRELRKIPKRWRPAAIIGAGAFAVGSGLVAHPLWERFCRWVASQPPIE